MIKIVESITVTLLKRLTEDLTECHSNRTTALLNTAYYSITKESFGLFVLLAMLLAASHYLVCDVSIYNLRMYTYTHLYTCMLRTSV